VPVVNFTNAQEPWCNLQHAHGVSCKIVRIYQIWNFSSTGKPVNWVHDCREPAVRSGP
jgi:hypothetical protein